MRNNFRKKNSGFIALTSTLILTIALMVLMFASNTSSFFARFDALGSEFKKVSLGLSESCANTALLKIAQNYDYDGDETIAVGEEECYINSINTVSEDSTQKTLEIKTSAKYPKENGSWSNNKVTVIIQNPEYSPTNPPPTCSFTAYPASIIEGDEVTLQWAIGGNASSFSIIRKIGDTETTLNPALGDTPFKDKPTANATYTATVHGASGNSQCETVQSVVVGLAPSCADTVLMLDRTANMSLATALSDEKTAANKLIDVYADIEPVPKISVGFFGKEGSTSPWNAEIREALSSAFDTLKDAVNDGLSSATGGTNLSSAIKMADDELNSSRHGIGRDKVIVLVSDGVPTAPSGNLITDQQSAKNAASNAKTKHGVDNTATEIYTVQYGDAEGRSLMATLASNSSNDHINPGQTTALPPTSFSEYPSGSDGWANPSGALSDNSDFANNADGGYETYNAFGFYPSEFNGRVATGIEIQADAWAEQTGCQLGVSLSWDGGTTWTSSASGDTNVQPLPVGENNARPALKFGGKNDTWGRSAWLGSELDASHFKVRVHDIHNTSCPVGKVISMDYIRTKIYYNGFDITAENGDKDRFYIAEKSSDLSKIFGDIADRICQKAGTAPLPPPPPSPPPAPPPPAPINIESWDEVINIL